jgi:hypothetical protein
MFLFILLLPLVNAVIPKIPATFRTYFTFEEIQAEFRFSSQGLEAQHLSIWPDDTNNTYTLCVRQPTKHCADVTNSRPLQFLLASDSSVSILIRNVEKYDLVLPNFIMRVVQKKWNFEVSFAFDAHLISLGSKMKATDIWQSHSKTIYRRPTKRDYDAASTIQTVFLYLQHFGLRSIDAHNRVTLQFKENRPFHGNDIFLLPKTVESVDALQVNLVNGLLSAQFNLLDGTNVQVNVQSLSACRHLLTLVFDFYQIYSPDLFKQIQKNVLN